MEHKEKENVKYGKNFFFVYSKLESYSQQLLRCEVCRPKECLYEMFSLYNKSANSTISNIRFSRS